MSTPIKISKQAIGQIVTLYLKDKRVVRGRLLLILPKSSVLLDEAYAVLEGHSPQEKRRIIVKGTSIMKIEFSPKEDKPLSKENR